VYHLIYFAQLVVNLMSEAGVATEHSTPFRGFSRRASPPVAPSTSAVPALAVLAGVILPPELGLSSGVALTPGRIGILLLVLPALVVLLGKNRRRLWPDLFVVATASWMAGSAVYVSGIGELWSAPGGECLEFLGGYLIARAYIFGPSALDKFIRVLRAVAVVVIVMALAEFAVGRLIVRDSVAALVGAKSAMQGAVFRQGMIRAVSTFEHPILFGSFCSLVLVLLLYWERSAPKRIFWAGFCLAGGIASLSSVAVLSFFIAVGLYTYDQLLRSFRWRWKAIWCFVIVVILAIFSIANAPLGWVITHLTFDPESGYFRLLIWDAATTYIGQAPLTGYAYNLLHNDILDTTVDSVWLVTSLRYGLPTILFILLANVTSCLPIRTTRNGTIDQSVTRMSTAFTIALMLFMIDGLTVHFWNFLWIFWGVCIGIRVSLREEALKELSRSTRHSHHPTFQAA
jgi:hypothetical protein